MKIQLVVKNNGKNNDLFSAECFAGFVDQITNKHLLVPHREEDDSIRWKANGVVTSCDLAERWRYDCLYLWCDLFLPEDEVKKVQKWTTVLCCENKHYCSDDKQIVKEATLISVKATPVFRPKHRPVAIFHNDNPIPGT